jgi:hypothetical protein
MGDGDWAGLGDYDPWSTEQPSNQQWGAPHGAPHGHGAHLAAVAAAAAAAENRGRGQGKKGATGGRKGGARGDGGGEVRGQGWEQHGGGERSWGNTSSWGNNDRWGDGGDGSAWPQAGGSWDVPTHQAQVGWTSWGEEARRFSKVTPAPSGSVGTRNFLSPQQHTQILNSLLDQPNQSHSAPHGSNQAQWKGGNVHQQRQKKQNQQQNQQQQQQQLQQKQLQQQQGGKKGKKNKQQQQNQALQDDQNQRRRPQYSGWGDSWGDPVEEDEYEEMEDPRRVQLQQQQGGKKGKKNKQQQQNQALQDDQNQRRRPQYSGWGDSWGDPVEEDEYEEMEDPRRVHFSPKEANPFGTQLGATYNMPSKTLAHAYQGTTTSINNGILPRNEMNEYTNVRFIESQGEALAPVLQAFFGNARLAKDRIHWMFSPDKDQRVASLLAWIQVMSYNLGAFGVSDVRIRMYSILNLTFFSSCTNFFRLGNAVHL